MIQNWKSTISTFMMALSLAGPQMPHSMEAVEYEETGIPQKITQHFLTLTLNPIVLDLGSEASSNANDTSFGAFRLVCKEWKYLSALHPT